jgi:uncharacterized small protein (DUF1192 family)
VPATTRRLPFAVLWAVIALTFSLTLGGVASAAPPGKDGKLHACYRVKGKPKGAMRMLRGAKARCQGGERKVSWTLAGAAGAPGAAGAAGAAGAGGASGSAGAAGAAGADGALSKTELEERITALTDRVETLEGILQGVSNEALTEALAAVAGLTNVELLAAVNSVPLVETLCNEVTGVIAQTNLLRGGVGTLVSTLSGSLLGPIFGSVGLPPALPETLTCPA